MLPKRLLTVTLLIGTVFSAMTHAQTKSHRVIFALTSSDEADWKLLLGNIRNLLADLGPESVEIEVVAYGPGLSFEKRGGPTESEIQTLEAKHVRFVACENTMRMQHATLAELITGVTSVPSGVVEVVTRQEQGWSYIKAGR